MLETSSSSTDFMEGQNSILKLFLLNACLFPVSIFPLAFSWALLKTCVLCGYVIYKHTNILSKYYLINDNIYKYTYSNLASECKGQHGAQSLGNKAGGRDQSDGSLLGRCKPLGSGVRKNGFRLK